MVPFVISLLGWEKIEMKTRYLIAALLAFGVNVVAQDQVKRDPQALHSLHDDPRAYIAFLDDPARDEYQKPHEVIAALGLREGETIADIGAGSGYFTFRFARHVGDSGRVYAVDVSPEMILHVNRNIRKLRVKNVITVLSDDDDPLLADGSIDRFFICDTWHHIENQTKYLALMKKMLKPGGQVIMMDFQKRDLPIGPPTGMKISREDLLAQMKNNGYRLLKEHFFLPYQYFLVFAPD